MKTIFLDIDGVLNNSASVHTKVGEFCMNHLANSALLEQVKSLAYGARFALRTFDPVCVELVNKLIEGAKAKLVLSSTHRLHFRDDSLITAYGDERHLALLRTYLNAMRIRVPDQFDITKNLHTIRGDEVREYLERHPEDAEQHVILDDSADFHGDQPLVLCDGVLGFTFQNYADACKILAAPEPGVILL